MPGEYKTWLVRQIAVRLAGSEWEGAPGGSAFILTRTESILVVRDIGPIGVNVAFLVIFGKLGFENIPDVTKLYRIYIVQTWSHHHELLHSYN